MPEQAWFFVVLAVIVVGLLTYLHVAEKRAKARVPPLSTQDRPEESDSNDGLLDGRFDRGGWGDGGVGL